MRQQKLDDDGLASSYLLLTALTPPTIYLIYSLLKKKPAFRCNCKECSAKKQKYNIPKILIVSFLVLIISYLCKNILTIKINTNSQDFDPFRILNVTQDTSFTEIKKNYRKMLKMFNKKLNRKNTKEEATEGIKNLNKAFTILKDPESLNKWLDSGSTKELMIAIPSFVLRFSTHFLIGYIILLIVAVPSFFFLKYLNFNNISFSGSEYSSNEMFYEEINNMSEVSSIIPNQLILLLGKSNEFKNKKWHESMPSDIVKTIEMKYHIPVMDDCDGYIRILSYITRELQNEIDREFVRSTAVKLIESFKKIAFAKNKAKVFRSLLILEKLINQTIHHPDCYRMQYPGIGLEESLMMVENDKKNLSSDEAFLRSVLQGKRLEIAVNILENIPVVEISDIKAFTIDTDINNCAFDKETIQIMKIEGNQFVLPNDSASFVQFKLTSNTNIPICHTPYSQEVICNKWTIYLKINDVLEGSFTVIDTFKGTKTIKLALPHGSSKQDVKINIISNGYFGNDVTSSLNIKYI